MNSLDRFPGPPYLPEDTEEIPSKEELFATGKAYNIKKMLDRMEEDRMDECCQVKRRNKHKAQIEREG